MGTGILTMPLYQTLPRADITCLDYSPDMMGQAREKAERMGLQNVQFRGIVTLSDDQTQMLQDAEVQMNSAKAQLQGTDYDRMLIYLTLPESSDETYAFTDKILEIAEKYYPDENVYLAGESTNEYEFEKSFAVDNKVVSIVSVLVVMLVLLFTFNSAAVRT